METSFLPSFIFCSRCGHFTTMSAHTSPSLYSRFSIYPLVSSLSITTPSLGCSSVTGRNSPYSIIACSAFGALRTCLYDPSASWYVCTIARAMTTPGNFVYPPGVLSDVAVSSFTEIESLKNPRLNPLESPVIPNSSSGIPSVPVSPTSSGVCSATSSAGWIIRV